MKRHLLFTPMAALLAFTPMHAALKVGEAAPAIKAPSYLGGVQGEFDLAAALKKGPVVLYFYPAAFTPGCTLEAHAFANAVDAFSALGATVIGVSHDTLDKKLGDFSTSECQGKFAVVADPQGSIIKAYDVVWAEKPQYASRTSYVITPDGRIIYTFTDLKNPDQHVANSLAALKAWKDKK